MARWCLAVILIITVPTVSFARKARNIRPTEVQSDEADSGTVTPQPPPVKAPPIQPTAAQPTAAQPTAAQPPAVQPPGGNTAGAASGTRDAAGATPGAMSSSPTQIFVWTDKNHVTHAVNNPSDVPPGYKKLATASTDPKEPVVRMVPDAAQSATAQPAKKGSGKERRQSSLSGRHKAGDAREDQRDSLDRKKHR